MVARQLRARGIKDERVLAAMGAVPRELFLPEKVRADAYRDGAVSIGSGQTMSQPWIVACMTASLGLTGDETVLEVGTGSGYGAAVLSRCARRVVTIERHVALADEARQTLKSLGYDNVDVRVGDGVEGAPDVAPFDGISVTAAATDDFPPALVAQLRPGGVLVCPVRKGDREVLLRLSGGRAEAIAPVRFVPLVTGGSAAR
jgi:protein-L-isoaspartate(D-aspartate) O-methyltransferase